MPTISKRELHQKIRSLPEEEQQIVYESMARYNFPAFVYKVFNTVSSKDVYKHTWHVQAICEYLEAVRRGQIKRLIINMPPRMMKTIIVSQAFPAWLLAHDPRTRIMAASHSKDEANRQSMQSRDILNSDWYKRLFPDVKFKEDQNQKGWFKTVEGGGRRAVSVGTGAATGDGADLIILDDPMNPMEASSEAERKRANEWTRSTIMSRLSNPKEGAIICVMQRLHENDTTGLLIEQGGYEVLSLPIMFPKRTTVITPKTCYELEKNELLFPEQIGHNEVNNLVQAMGDYHFAAQYMQHPAPLGGGLFKKSMFMSYNSETKPTSFDCVIHSWDTSEGTAGGDPSACTIWGIAKNGIYLLQVINERIEPSDLPTRVQKLAARDNPLLILIERKSTGASLISWLQRNTMLKIYPVDVNGGRHAASKMMRAEEAVRVIARRPVYLPDVEIGDPSMEAYIQQLTLFPNAKHDDMVDSTSQFLQLADKNIDLWLRPHSLDYDERFEYRDNGNVDKYTGY